MLYLDYSGQGLLTSGNNRIINFLLGEGLDDKIFACRGKNLVDNSYSIMRENILNQDLFECELSFIEEDDSFSLQFSSNIGSGETYEIVFLIGSEPFARINLLDYKENTLISSTFSPKTSYLVDLGENVKSLNSIVNNSTLTNETQNVFTSNYAYDFGDKITLPFNNLFDNKTPRFVSKDGKMIFFIIYNKLYAFFN